MKAAAPRRCRAGALALAAALLASSPHVASAYVAAGDRTFPAMILLPQVAPADQLFMTPTTQPVSGGRSTDVAVNFAKTLTERLGVPFQEDYTWLGSNAASTLTGWQNLQVVTQYLAILEPAHEALFTLGVNRQWGGTGTRRIGVRLRGRRRRRSISRREWAISISAICGHSQSPAVSATSSPTCRPAPTTC
jgi:hypothetical protein